MASAPIDLRALAATYDFPPETETKLVDLLNAVVNSSADRRAGAAEAAAAGIDQLCPRNDEAEGFLWSLWTFIIDIAKGTPTDHVRIQDLVDAVEALKAKQSGTIEIWESWQSLWADMPLFGAVMREAWNGVPEFNESLEQASKIEEWTCLNSFAARLLGASIQGWTNLALWELRDGLEEETSNELARDVRLITASEWIIHAGKVLYDEGRTDTLLDEHAVRSLRPGTLLEGSDSGFSEERWRFWKKRFEELSVDARVEARKKAEKALEVMNSLEA